MTGFSRLFCFMEKNALYKDSPPDIIKNTKKHSSILDTFNAVLSDKDEDKARRLLGLR